MPDAGKTFDDWGEWIIWMAKQYPDCASRHDATVKAWPK